MEILRGGMRTPGLLPRTSGGFSLIEVLISMVVLAFGILAMGGLQLASLRSNQMSANFTSAATLAKEYSEMMRSNPSISNIVTTTAGLNPYIFDSSSTSTFTVTPSATCKTSTCTAAQMATLHVADWAARVQAQLPGGRAVACRDSAPRNTDGSYKWVCDNSGSLITLKLGWTDRRDKDERGTTATFAVTAPNPQLVLVGFTGYSE